jgi:galactokinase/mevalonate kinase-like predicted kinase
VSARKLAEESCRIEIDVLKKPIGRQDQYAAAFGGLNYMKFHSDHSVEVEPVPCRPVTLHELEQRVMLFYTEKQRDADRILKAQSDGTKSRFSVLKEMRDLAATMRDTLTGPGDLDEFARLLHEGWLLKRSLGFGISSGAIDEWYEAARRAGAQGGKLLGAGGGGFLLVMVPRDRRRWRWARRIWRLRWSRCRSRCGCGSRRSRSCRRRRSWWRSGGSWRSRSGGSWWRRSGGSWWRSGGGSWRSRACRAAHRSCSQWQGT